MCLPYRGGPRETIIENTMTKNNPRIRRRYETLYAQEPTAKSAEILDIFRTHLTKSDSWEQGCCGERDRRLRIRNQRYLQERPGESLKRFCDEYGVWARSLVCSSCLSFFIYRLFLSVLPLVYLGPTI